MHVAIEALQLRRDQRGIGRYVRSLLEAMPRVEPEIRYTLSVESSNEVQLVRDQLSQLAGVADRCTVVTLDSWRATECDVAWYPWNFVRYVPARGAIVPTIHDLTPMLQLDGRWWKFVRRARARRAYQRSAKLADHVITGAAAARDELVARLEIAATDVSVVHHAADGFRRFVEDPTLVAEGAISARSLLSALGVGESFVLAVGSQEPRKNLPVLLAAMAQLNSTGLSLPLVLCGPKAGRAIAGEFGRAPWLRWAGFVDDVTLATLYRQSTALVVPSRYEGFGLPVLECMTAGGVVVCSAVSTLPEVGGEAALYFDPDSPEQLVEALTRLVRDPSLRERYRTLGATQAAAFSWAASARGTVEAFRRGIARNGGYLR